MFVKNTAKAHNKNAPLSMLGAGFWTDLHIGPTKKKN